MMPFSIELIIEQAEKKNTSPAPPDFSNVTVPRHIGRKYIARRQTSDLHGRGDPV
jgi:hypothetical protein